MKTTQCKVLGLVIALGAGAATAQVPYVQGPYGWDPGGGGPGYFGGPMGPASRIWLDVETEVARDVFVVAIRYAGITPEELKLAQDGRDLRIYVDRSTQQVGPYGRMFGGSWMSRNVSLPADADPSQMQRQEGPGFVMLLIPRRMMGPRW